jgi:hypothetical protein
MKKTKQIICCLFVVNIKIEFDHKKMIVQVDEKK